MAEDKKLYSNKNAVLNNTPYIDALIGRAELLPDMDVTRTFTDIDEAVGYTRGQEFNKRFNPNGDKYVGIRADFQGTDRGVRLPQATINAEAEAKLKPLKDLLSKTTDPAKSVELQKSINQIENRAWYSKRFYTNVNSPTSARDLKYYLAGGLKDQGVWTVPSPLTVVAGSDTAAMVPLAEHAPFGGATPSFKQGQEWIKGWKKDFNFPSLIAQGGNEAKAAAYLSTNTASELFPTAATIERYARPAGMIDPDNQTIDLYGRAKNPAEYRMISKLTPFERAAGKVGGVASLLLEAPENYSVLTKRHKQQERTKAGANWYDAGNAADSFIAKPISLSDKLKIAKDSVVQSALSAITFGATSVGARGDRPTRGMSQIGQERGGGEVGADESRRALIERSKNWTPK